MTRHVLSKADNNAVVEVQAGDSVVIELSELATAGYAWEVEHAPEKCDIELKPLGTTSDAIGAESRVQITVVVNFATHGDLLLRHRQAWNPNSADDSFRIGIKMKG